MVRTVPLRVFVSLARVRDAMVVVVGAGCWVRTALGACRRGRVWVRRAFGPWALVVGVAFGFAGLSLMPGDVGNGVLSAGCGIQQAKGRIGGGVTHLRWLFLRARPSAFVCR